MYTNNTNFVCSVQEEMHATDVTSLSYYNTFSALLILEQVSVVHYLLITFLVFSTPIEALLNDIVCINRDLW